MKRAILLMIIAALAIIGEPMSAFAKDKWSIVAIKTSAVCNTCKLRIENDLSFEKGIKRVNLNLEDQMVTVAFDTTKTNKEAVKRAITLIGYDADEMAADEKAHNKLPACCKKGNTPH